ncbi:MAG: hypothetical protein CM1200mP18_17810 [Gammaproteobacteria bacterium]|nr:MAG: hypothetical protein CM1200mP18_17810 [Gammaproteobacteria bacterium]
MFAGIGVPESRRVTAIPENDSVPVSRLELRYQRKLVGIPDKQSFPGIDRTACSLIPLPVTESDGMIWASATPGLTSEASINFDIDSQLEGLGAELRARA